MAGRIPQAFIDDLVARTDIVELIDERVPLKRGGRDYKACCPFHEEKTPSFTVSREKQFYHCFGCGAHGTALGFLMEYQRLDFVEAVETLARRAGVEVPREGGAGPRTATAPVYETLARADEFYRAQLRDHPRAARAVEYLRGRGLDGETAAAFALGYAPPGWDNLVRALGTDESARDLLVRAGLVVKRDDGGIYDRLRDRVVFPIRDRRGRTIGFGARALGDETPKYLNSPETEVFHKGRELYGLHEAARARPAPRRMLVVEGYMDVVALAQHGVAGAVAVLGTALTADHLEKLFRAASEVVFCFDGDEAGRRAAWRALETALPALAPRRSAAFAFLPEGEDPDSLVRARGREAFEHLIDEALPLTEFMVEHLAADGALDSVERRAALVNRAAELLRKAPDEAFRHLATEYVANKTGLDENKLSTLIGGGERRPEARRTPMPTRGRPSLMRTTLALLLHHPGLAAEVDRPGELRFEGIAGSGLLAEMVELLRQRPDLKTGAVIEHFREHPEGRHLGRLLGAPVPPAGPELAHEFRDRLARMREAADDERFRALAERARERPLDAAERAEFARLAARAGTSGTNSVQRGQDPDTAESASDRTEDR